LRLTPVSRKPQDLQHGLRMPPGSAPIRNAREKSVGLRVIAALESIVTESHVVASGISHVVGDFRRFVVVKTRQKNIGAEICKNLDVQSTRWAQSAYVNLL